MNYADAKTYLADELAAEGLTPRIDPGPASLAELQKLSPQDIVFLTVGGGAGLSFEGAFDRPFIGVHVIGRQGDYDGAEKLAKAVDRAFLRIADNAEVGEAFTLYITRTGGGPQLAGRDSADRYHFGCTYVTETEL